MTESQILNTVADMIMEEMGGQDPAEASMTMS